MKDQKSERKNKSLKFVPKIFFTSIILGEI